MRIRTLAALVSLSLLACESDQTPDAGRNEPLIEQQRFPVKGYHESSSATFDSLSDLREKSTVIAVVDVIRARDGKYTSPDAPDSRTVQRILDVVVVEPLKGTQQGDELSVWESRWDLVPQGNQGWKRTTLLVATDDYAIGPHERVLMALVPDPGDATLYAMQSVSSYFVLDPDDQERFKIIDRRNPVAADIQGRPVREVVDALHASVP